MSPLSKVEKTHKPTASPLALLNLLGISVLISTWAFQRWVPNPISFLEQLPWRCPFYEWTHLPCSTCGFTRGFVLAVQGRWDLAFQYYPFAIPAYLGILGFLLLSILSPSLAERVLKFSISLPVLVSLVILLVLSWGYRLLSTTAMVPQ